MKSYAIRPMPEHAGAPSRPVFTLGAGLELVLASASPRRRRFLESWGLPCRLLVPDAVEPRPKAGESPVAYTRRAARAKAAEVGRRLGGPAERASAHSVILAADTAVAVPGELLGKPGDAAHALAMLRSLNGRWHAVVSSVCLLVPPALSAALPERMDVEDICRGGWRELVFSDTCHVRFGEWPDAILRAYASTGEPADKAGAYAVQGQGAFLVARMEGAWSTVVGLPAAPLAALLLALGVMRPAAA